MNTAGSSVSLSLWELVLVSINSVYLFISFACFQVLPGNVHYFAKNRKKKKKKLILSSLANLRGTLIKRDSASFPQKA